MFDAKVKNRVQAGIQAVVKPGGSKIESAK
jgi:AICAR transformylase/IMP cyclohydrolase PurH